jgi:hypothetical protein
MYIFKYAHIHSHMDLQYVSWEKVSPNFYFPFSARQHTHTHTWLGFDCQQET